MTRAQILTNYPSIKTVTVCKKSRYFVRHPEDEAKRGYMLHMYERQLELKDDFNFVVWRMNKSRSTGEVLFEGPCIATYTKDVAQIYAQSMNASSKDDLFTIRAIA